MWDYHNHNFTWKIVLYYGQFLKKIKLFFCTLSINALICGHPTNTPILKPWGYSFFMLPPTGTKASYRNLYFWNYAYKYVAFSWHLPNTHDQIVKRYLSLQRMFLLPHCPVVECFTCNDLVCSILAVEIHLKHIFRAHTASRASVELWSEWWNRTGHFYVLCTPVTGDSALIVCYHWMAKQFLPQTLPFQNNSTHSWPRQI